MVDRTIPADVDLYRAPLRPTYDIRADRSKRLTCLNTEVIRGNARHHVIKAGRDTLTKEET